MKKLIGIFVAALILVSCLGGCSTSGEQQPGGIRIVTTIFPEYDWVRAVLGDRAESVQLTLLLDNGTDLHSYQPTAADIMKISSCDLFVYVGGESDEWVEDALSEATNQNMIVLNLLDILGDHVKEEEIVEGMQTEDEEESEGEEEKEYDEHVWLSLKNASAVCDAIADALSKLDPENAAKYKANASAYEEQLSALDQEYQNAVDASSIKTLLVGDRFPFRYLADDYALDYYAAFVGCSAETEASFDTIVFLANKVDEMGLPAILTLEGSDHRIAETIRDNTASKDQQILTLDSLQSVTAEGIEEGMTYLQVMTQNLVVLKEALR